MSALLALAVLAFIVILAFVSGTPLSRYIKNARAGMSKPVRPFDFVLHALFFGFAAWIAAGGVSLIDRYVHLPKQFHWVVVGCAWGGLFYVFETARIRVKEISAKEIVR